MPRAMHTTIRRALVGQHTLRRAERNLLRCGRLPGRRAWRAPVWLAVHAVPPLSLLLAAVGFVVAAATATRVDVAGAATAGAVSALVCAVWCEPWVMEAAHGFGASAALAFLMARHADGRALTVDVVGRLALQATVLVFATGGLALAAWRLRNLSVQRAVCRPDADVLAGPPRGPREHR